MGIIKDPTSWRTGFELGLAGFSFPYSKPRKPTAYLYNGIRLPALPEWDRGVYPYAVLQWREEVAGSQSVETRLFVSTEPPYKGSLFCIIPVGSSGVVYKLNEKNEWYAHTSWTPNLDMSGSLVVPHWSNYDMLKSDGTVYLAASDPVPVYE